MNSQMRCERLPGKGEQAEFAAETGMSEAEKHCHEPFMQRSFLNCKLV
jgi:hypothetical protein